MRMQSANHGPPCRAQGCMSSSACLLQHPRVRSAAAPAPLSTRGTLKQPRLPPSAPGVRISRACPLQRAGRTSFSCQTCRFSSFPWSSGEGEEQKKMLERGRTEKMDGTLLELSISRTPRGRAQATFSLLGGKNNLQPCETRNRATDN